MRSGKTALTCAKISLLQLFSNPNCILILAVMTILRQGNTNSKVQIFRYITEGSFDAYSWQLLETKQRFITGLLSGSLTERSGTDIEDLQLLHLFADVLHFAVLSDLCAAVAISILSFVVSDASCTLRTVPAFVCRYGRDRQLHESDARAHRACAVYSRVSAVYFSGLVFVHGRAGLAFSSLYFAGHRL